jgi:hypothetical protein
MTEVYPNDSDLLNILSDVETGVEYIPTGTAPYYLHFRKLLHRLLLGCKRGNDLRLFDEGGLSIGVKPGKFWFGNSLVSFTGASGVTLADDKGAVYVYLDSSGTLVTNEYTAFPDMSMDKHVRLAVVTTSGGDITSIVDSRDHHSIAMPGVAAGTSLTIVNHTANATLTENQSGMVHTNRGATGMITLTLPANPTEGITFRFAVQAVQSLAVDPGAATIRDDCGQTAGKYKWANAIGECIEFVADSNGDWLTISKRGTWLQEV